MSDETQLRMKYTYYSIMSLLQHLDDQQRQGEPRYENKGQLIKTAGQLRDEIGRENVHDDIDFDAMDKFL